MFYGIVVQMNYRNEHNPPHIHAVYHGSHVALRFSDGHCGVLDMSPYMDDGVFKRLRDPNVFKTARAGVSTVEWDNGTIDVAPETAYAHAAPFGA